jgi:hypothetical protein
LPEVVEPDAEVARTFLHLVAGLLVGTDAIVTIFLDRPGGNPPPFRLDLTSSASEGFRSRATEWAARVGASELVSYDPGRTLVDGEASFQPTETFRAAVQLSDALRVPLDLNLFSPSVTRQAPPRFYVVSLRERGHTEQVHLVRRLDAGYRLHRSRVYALIWSNGTYDELRGEPLFFRADFDAVIGTELTVVTDQRNVDAMFGLVEEALQLARKTLASVTSDLVIRNYPEFEEAVLNDLNMVSKLHSITELRRDPRYREAMTTQRIVAFAKQNPKFQIDWEGREGSESLVFHSDAQRRWRLLRLLDDQFVRSIITSLDYEANSKSRLL